MRPIPMVPTAGADRKAVIKSLALALILMAAAFSAAAQPAAMEETEPVAVDAVGLAGDSVVKIWATVGEGDISFGSGFLVAPDRIVTNNHVIGTAATGLVTIRLDGAVRSGQATVLARRPENDLALLSVEGLGLAPLGFAGAELRAGLQVAALGYPGDADNRPEEAATLEAAIEATELVFRSAGQIAKIEDTQLERGGPRMPVVFHDALIHSGHSGGPLVDACGRVIGVNTALTLEAEFPLAVAASLVVDFLEDNGVAPLVVDAPCVPTSAPPIPAPAPQQPEIEAAENVAQVPLLVWIGLGGSAGLALIAIVLAAMRRETAAAKARRLETLRFGARVAAAHPVRYLLRDGDGGVTSFDAQRAGRADGVVIGRDPELADHHLSADAVSRRHLRLAYRDGQLYAEDLNSARGSSVDGRRLAPFVPVPVAPGSRLVLAETAVTLQRG